MRGSWASHAIVHTSCLIVLDDSQDLKYGAHAIVNPLTACHQLDVARKRKTKAVIVTAAASQLSKQFNRLVKDEGIVTINLVRKEEQI